MNTTTLTTWRAYLISARNALRHETRMKVALVVALLFNAILGLWSANQLVTRLHQWQGQGTTAINTGLWLLCLSIWAGMAFFTFIGTLWQALGSDEALLLFTLPIPPATRFRTLYGSFFISIEGLWAWLFLELGVTGYVLISSLGWQGLKWLVLLQLGAGVAILLSLVGVLSLVYYVLSASRLKVLLAIIILAGLLLLLALFLIKTINVSVLVLALKPEYIIALFALLLAAALGPFAYIPGKLYSAAFYTIQGRHSSRKSITIPGTRALSRLLARQRNLIAAMFTKALLSQTRSIFFWLRILVTLIVLALFPVIQHAAAHYGFSNVVIVIGYTVGLVFLHANELAMNAFSGEGNRLTLYLTAPFSRSHLLRARLILFLLPTLLEGSLIGCFLAWRLELPINQAALAIASIMLMITGIVTFLVFGSTWDEDLTIAVEGVMETLMQEEAPVTPKRMWLLNMGVGLLASTFLLIWKLPPIWAIASLVVLNGSIVTGMRRFGYMQLRRLVRAA